MRDVTNQSRGRILLENLNHLYQNTPDFAGAYYRNLFKTSPEIASKFLNVNMASQEAMFMELLRFVTTNYDNKHMLDSRLEDLRARHVVYGATREEFGIVGACLLETFKQCCESQWSVQLELQWRSLLEYIGDMMFPAPPTEPL
jgi:hemoglobin-like flavoprotein